MIEGWKEVRIVEVTEMVKRGIAPKYVTEEGYVVINQKCIRNGVLSFDDARLTSLLKKVSEEKFVKIGDVLINSTGTGTLGRTAPVRKLNGPTTVDTHVTIVRGNDRVDNLFFGYLLSYYEPLITLLGKGATNQIELGASDLKVTKIVIPESKETQRKIASILSAYDDLIENNLKRIQLLEEKAQLTYEEWFVRMKFPGHENVAINEETGLPEGWGKENFDNCLNFKTGKLDSNALVEKGEFDFYTCAKEIYKTDSYCFEGEAVLLGGNNATGDFALFYANDKFDAYQRTYIVTSKNQRLPLVYVFYYLKMLLPYFKIVSSGASTKFLTMRILNKTKILNPKEEILDEFEQKIKPCFNSILIFQKHNQLLKEARDILLPRLMTGIINPSEMEGGAVNEVNENAPLQMVAEDKVMYKKK